MKYPIFFFLIIGFIACNEASSQCQFSFKDFLESNPLKNWEERTRVMMSNSKNEKLVFLSNALEKDGVDLYDRKNFLNEMAIVFKENSLEFSELRILEISTSGEGSNRRKILFLICGDVGMIKTLKNANDHWVVSRSMEKKKEEIDNLFKLLEDKRDKTVFFGHRRSEVLVFSEIHNKVITKVNVYSSLNQKQYDAISGF